MNKKILYIGIAVLVGLLAGYLIFGNGATTKKETGHDHAEEMASSEMWTCSMHPQIMQSEPGDCPLCGMDLIPAESGEDGLAMSQFKMTKNAMALADIRTTKVGSGSNGDNTLKLSGTIKENEKAVATQASYFDGRIEKLFVNFEGEQVRNGQQLATLYSPELVSAQQELITAASLKASQPDLYKAVRNKLKLWKLSDKQIEQIEESGQVRENFPLYANVSGTVSEIMIEAGDYVKKGSPLFKIANLGTVWAVFDAYENQVSLLKEGQNIDIVTKSYPDKKINAKISFINPILNSSKRTVEVRAVLQNPKDLLKPGMFVSGSLGLTSKMTDDILVIPESAVLWTGERSVVYVKTDPDDPTFEIREVTVGDVINGGYSVLSGLQNGDEIVTNGTFTVDAAAQLKGKKSMMNTEGGKTMTGHEGHTGMRSETESSMTMEMALPKPFQIAFQSALTSYLKMKDAFVASDASQVAIFSNATAKSFKAIDTGSLDKMELAHFDKGIEMLDAIGKNDNLENQRMHFVVLNENLAAIAMNIDKVDTPLYVQKCPMANNNKGAVWLSSTKEIMNPYFGEAMLSCGSVVKTIHE